MSAPLLKQIRDVRRRIRRQTLLAGACAVTAIGIGAVLAVGTVDFFVQLEDPGLRILATLCVVGALIWSVRRFLVAPMRRRMSDVRLAQEIESHAPVQNDLLSNAVAFANATDDLLAAGSSALRRAVIVQAVSQCDSFSWNAVVPRRALRRSVAAVLGAIALIAIVALADGSAVRIASARLLWPLGNDHWPRDHQLVVRSAPRLIASGDTIEVEVVDTAGALPDRVLFHYRFDRNGDWEEHELPMMVLNDAAIARLDSVVQPLEFRVTGGDDRTMSWRAIGVVDPPRVRALRVTLQPPKYTGYKQRNSERNIRILEGTRIALAGETSETVTAAHVVFERGEPIEAVLEKDQRHFSVPADRWTATDSMTYWLELVGADDLIGGRQDRYHVRAIPDAPPSVSFEAPKNDLFVTPNATIPLRILIKDDLAIRDVDLVFFRSDQSSDGEKRKRLYEGPSTPAVADSETDPTRAPGELQTIEHSWELAEMQLMAGAVLQIHIEASDYRPGVGQTISPRRVTIITPDELGDRLAERHAAIRSELVRALRRERESREGVRAVDTQLREMERLAPRDVDQLQTAALGQRQVERHLLDPNDGVVKRVAELLDQVQLNRIDNPAMSRRLRDLGKALNRFKRRELNEIERELTAALKSADAQRSDEAHRSIVNAGEAQDRLIQSLEKIIADLEQWAGYRRFARDIGQLRADQQAIAATVREEFSLLSDLDDDPLTTRQRQTDLKKHAANQRALARRIDAIAPQMEAAAEKLADSDPVAAQTLSDGLELLRRRAVGGTMRDASRNLEADRVGRAMEQQASAAEQLDELLDTLRNRREDELGRIVKKMREAEKELEGMRKQLAGLKKKLSATAKSKDAKADPKTKRELQRLQRQQKSLQEDIERLARRLKRLTADRAGRSTQRAADHLAGSPDQSGENQSSDQAENLDAIERAAKDLEDAQKQLSDARRRAEEDLVREQVARFETAVRSLIAAESHIFQETQRLEGLRTANRSTFTDAQKNSVDNLASEQRLVYAETIQHAESAGGMGVLRLALRRASHAMDLVAERLGQGKTDGTTQASELTAVKRLEQLLASITEKDDSDEGDQNGNKDGGGKGGQGGQSNDSGPSVQLAELKLLKQLQIDLRDQTKALEEKLTAADPQSSDDRVMFNSLAQDQAELADVIFAILDPDGAGSALGDNDETDSDDEMPDLDRALEESLDLPPLDLMPWQRMPFAYRRQSQVAKETERQESVENDQDGNQPADAVEESDEIDNELRRALGSADGEDIGGDGASDTPADPILRIAERMRSAEEAIADGDVSGKASGEQERAIEDLQRIIDQLKQSKKKKASSSNSNSQPKNGRSQPPQSKAKRKSQASRRSSKPARDSTEQVGRGADDAVDRNAMRELLKDVWGNLPAKTRETMLEAPSDRFLPEFELEIEQYFRRLAEDPEFNQP